MAGLRSESLLYLFKFLYVLVLFNMSAASLCLMISIVFRDASVASLMAILNLLFQMLFGGFLINQKSVPPMISFMKNLSFFGFAFEAVAVNEVNGLKLMDEKAGQKIETTGALVLNLFGLNPQNYWLDVKYLWFTCVLLISLSYIWLQIMVKERR
jgi:hypothetical protein